VQNSSQQYDVKNVGSKAKVALKKTRLLGKLQLLSEEVFAGKIVAIDGDKKGYEQLKMALKKTIDSLTC